MTLRPRTASPLYVLGAVALACWALAAAGLRFNLSPSAALGVYRLTELKPDRGSMVAACLPRKDGQFGRRRGYLRRGSCPGDAAPVLKRVAAAAGDRVEITTVGVFVNGVRLQEPAPHADPLGRPLKPLPLTTYAIGAGEVWLYSGHPDSWDSRFYGTLPVSSLLGSVRPLVVARADTVETAGEPPGRRRRGR